MNSKVVHEALVVACLPGGRLLVRVCPTVSDGCSGCALAMSCDPKRAKGEEIEFTAIWSGSSAMPEAGERVLVSPVQGGTSRAATLLMAVPLAGLLGGVLISAACGAGDGASALCGLGGCVAGFVPAFLLSRGHGKRTSWEARECIESIIDLDI
ncbi:MAG: SoxR reducing system RseC family protein [Muribaculaceae bacterium]|nr:SoxR reducing system RseC family protein [Muribaculaceae bacterium]